MRFVPHRILRAKNPNKPKYRKKYALAKRPNIDDLIPGNE